MSRTAYCCVSLLLVSTLLGCLRGSKPALPYYNTPDFTPLFLGSTAEAHQKVSHTIGAFALTDQQGRPFSRDSLLGKVHVANFMFTRCGSICPAMMGHLKGLQSAYGNRPDFALLAFSVTPWIDSVARLRAYAEDQGIIAPNWHLLTGPKAVIYPLARRSYFAEEEFGFSRDSSAFLHTEHVLLVDRTGRLRGIYNGTLSLEIEQCTRDVAVLLDERE